MKLRPRRGKSYFSSGLWERKHRERMGQAVWLFGWLVDRQTKQKGTMGLVLRGRGLTYAEIAESMNESPRTVERWMSILRATRYIEVRHTAYSKMVIYIHNSKKFGRAQNALALDFMSRRVAGLKSRKVAGHLPADLRDSRNERSKVLSTSAQAKDAFCGPTQEQKDWLFAKLRQIGEAHPVPAVAPAEETPLEMSEREYRERYGLAEKETVPA